MKLKRNGGNFGNNVEFAGELDMRTYVNLEKKGIIDKRFEFYSDFRWDAAFIGQMKQTIQNKKVE